LIKLTTSRERQQPEGGRIVAEAAAIGITKPENDETDIFRDCSGVNTLSSESGRTVAVFIVTTDRDADSSRLDYIVVATAI